MMIDSEARRGQDEEDEEEDVYSDRAKKNKRRNR
jgi:hypothetical protein